MNEKPTESDENDKSRTNETKSYYLAVEKGTEYAEQTAEAERIKNVTDMRNYSRQLRQERKIQANQPKRPKTEQDEREMRALKVLFTVLTPNGRDKTSRAVGRYLSGDAHALDAMPTWKAKADEVIKALKPDFDFEEYAKQGDKE